MNIQLINGQFSASDLLELITQLIQTKIKYHEDKISNKDSEEEIKYREEKIKRLQKELSEARMYILSNNNRITVSSSININNTI